MDAAYFRFLFDYTRWANARVLEAADGLDEAAYTEARFPFGSLRSVLVHTLAGETVWLARCRGETPSGLLTEAEAPTLAALRERWRALEEARGAFLAGLTDEAVARPLTYRSTRGQAYTHALGHVLAHVANHSTQHRSEAAVALTALGRSPGDLDLVVYLRQGG